MLRANPFVLAAVVVASGCAGRTISSDPVVIGTEDASVEDTTSPPKFGACAAPGTCVLALATCCGSCGEPKLSDKSAINRTEVDAYRTFVCPVPEPCPRCATMQQPNFQAFCRTGRCAAIDVRTDTVSRCVRDADCRLRFANCCECPASSEDLIAIAVDKESEYSSQVCAPGTPCPDCAVMYPTDRKARCNTSTQHCYIGAP